MEAPDSIHPTDQTLRAYGVGKLYGSLADSVDAHLSECGTCRQRVAELSDDTFLGRLREAQHRPDSPAPVAPPPGGMSMADGSEASIKPPPSGSIPPGLAEHADYEILGELGRGGMGVVYLAQNKLMGRKEVLKVVSRELMDRRGVLDRFLREIRNAGQLHHPNIVTAYSAVRAGESIVFAMEYVEGHDLSLLVKGNGPLPVAHACNFIYQAALGLQYAHEKGMVHRDIKPSNLILARHGKKPVVKVLDFGLAKATREGPVDKGLTHEGQMLGTPDYIAPEQSLDATKADIRADIYSLGCTLYYLLSGGPPFGGASLYEVLQAHHSMEARPLNLVRPEVPWELAAVVARMMAKDPGRRYQTPVEVAQALKPFFRVGESRTAGSKPDVSQVVPPIAESRAPVTERAPGTNLAPGTANTRAAGQAKSSHGEPLWENLIQIADAEEPLAPSVKPSPQIAGVWRQPWIWSAVGAGVVLFGLSIAWVVRVLSPPGPETLANEGPRSSKGAGPLASAPQPAVWTSPATKMAFVRIEGGEFWMGSPASDHDAGADEKPPHKVRISPFYLDVTEVTQAQYQAVMGNNPSWFSATGGGSERVMGRSTDQYPVEDVSWLEAVTFCNWLSQNDSLKAYYQITGDDVQVPDPKSSGYRLPTEAEWEYACRAGKTTKFSFGDDPSQLGDYAWYQANSVGMTHPVRQKGRNAFGLYDMHGNVSEWCWDRYDGSFYGRSPQADPLGPSGAAARVIRGGCWDSFGGYCRSAHRNWYEPVVRYGGLGFRVARNGSAEGGDQLATAQPEERQPPEFAQTSPPAAQKPRSSADAELANSRGLRTTWTSPFAKITLVRIEGGEFLIGSPLTDRDAEADERPQHKVRISPFYLGATEVTQEQYQTVMGSNPTWFSATGGGKEKVEGRPTGQLPVERVSWFDAVAFCNVLSRRDGLDAYYDTRGDDVRIRDPKGSGYRLPTEAEWEYACRAGAPTRYCFGDGPAKLGDFAWYSGNSSGVTHLVRQKAPNGFGLYDMHGNVWEWCWDYYEADSYRRSQPADPRGPSAAAVRVLRGGGWSSNPARCRSAYRFWSEPAYRNDFLGFRLALGQSGG